MIFDIRFRISFLHSLAKNGKRLIGRYEDGTSGDLPGLGIKMISDTFHWEGKCES